MSAPKRVEQIPVVNSPVIFSEVRESRTSSWAWVLTGVVAVVTVVLLIVGMVLS